MNFNLPAKILYDALYLFAIIFMTQQLKTKI